MPARATKPQPRPKQPTVVVIAGPNGAGKSTAAPYLLKDALGILEFVNADLYEQAHLKHIADPEARSESARQWADGRRAALLREGTDFASETMPRWKIHRRTT